MIEEVIEGYEIQLGLDVGILSKLVVNGQLTSPKVGQFVKLCKTYGYTSRL